MQVLALLVAGFVLGTVFTAVGMASDNKGGAIK